jgi:L-alanine-DL-glutamate epimerase-like enolase superfamily enzyme
VPMGVARGGIPIDGVEVSVFEVPTDQPESDGTLEWSSTTLVLTEVAAGGKLGLGYTYGPAAAAGVVTEQLTPRVVGQDAMSPRAAWDRMVAALRNAGRPGIGSLAVSAVDAALWDLKARLLELPLATLLGAVRPAVPVYGSGGFTSYSDERLREQLEGWVEAGIGAVKMKVGREPAKDLARVRLARRAIGEAADLFVDANGAFQREEALAFAHRVADQRISWFEEPVSSDDLTGLRMLRDRAPPGMEITAGEYGYDLPYFRRMLGAGAVDVLMPDATRCGGITGFTLAVNLCEAFGISASSHTAPALHLHACCALGQVRHMEYFHDHVRVERMLFEGVTEPRNGLLAPDLERPGNGLELRRADAARYLVS